MTLWSRAFLHGLLHAGSPPGTCELPSASPRITRRSIHIVTESNEPTTISPNAPKKRGRPKKVQTSEASAILDLQKQLADLKAQLQSAPVASEKEPTEGQGENIPGEYFEDGVDPATGRKRMSKRRWSRSEIERRYPKVTFTPMVSMPVKPHGITKGGWDLYAGKEVTVPAIVKDLYENSVRAIESQVKAYPGATQDQERAIFEAARNDPLKGRHATPLQHVGFGWSESALRAAATGTIDPGHEPEMGFPGGYKGGPVEEKSA